MRVPATLPFHDECIHHILLDTWCVSMMPWTICVRIVLGLMGCGGHMPFMIHSYPVWMNGCPDNSTVSLYLYAGVRAWSHLWREGWWSTPGWAVSPWVNGCPVDLCPERNEHVSDGHKETRRTLHSSLCMTSYMFYIYPSIFLLYVCPSAVSVIVLHVYMPHKPILVSFIHPYTHIFTSRIISFPAQHLPILLRI